MPTSPGVYANEATPPVVQGGSNFVWMVTEHQRRTIVDRQVCLHNNSNNNDNKKTEACPPHPHAVMPLGDLESFQIQYSPDSALGKQHVRGREPGYSYQDQREAVREIVRDRGQLKGQEDIDRGLFEYTIYPSALFRKDATLKAARSRDAFLSETTKPKHNSEKDNNNGDNNGNGGNDGGDSADGRPQWIKSAYYDVTITEPRPPLLGWCQAIARKGLCVLYAHYFRTSNDVRCLEACGMSKNFTPI